MPAVYAMQPESIHFREALGAYDSWKLMVKLGSLW